MKKIYQNYKKTCITLIALVCFTLFYTLFGFLGVPWVIKSVLPWILEDKNATLEVRDAKFNPYTFELNVTGASLKTYTDVLKFEELDVGLNFKELFSKNINIDIVRIQEPYVNIQREQNLSFNFDSLIVSDEPKKEDKKSNDSESFFNVTLNKFKIINGDARYADASLQRPFEGTLRDISYEINDINLKEHSIGKHLLETDSNLMDDFDWKGGVSINPLKIYGDIKVSGLKMDKIWQSYMSELDFNVTKGLFDTNLKYIVSIDDGGIHVDLKDTSFGARDFFITDKNSTLVFDKILFDELNLGGNFSGKNELKFALKDISLENLKYDELRLKAAKILGINLNLSSEDKLELDGDIKAIKIDEIEQNSTLFASLKSLNVEAIKYALKDEIKASFNGLFASDFSLKDGKNRLLFDSFDINNTSANFNLNSNALALNLPYVNLTKFSFYNDENNANFSSLNLADTNVNFDIDKSELDMALPDIKLAKIEFKNADINAQNELFYIKDTQVSAKEKFSDISASIANFGLSQSQFSGFDFNVKSKNFNFTGFDADVKSENNVTRMNLNLDAVKTQNIDINALKQKFISLSSIGADELKFDGKNARIKGITLEKTDVFSADKNFAGLKSLNLSDMDFDIANSALLLENVKVDSLFFNDEISQKGSKAINNLAILNAQNPQAKQKNITKKTAAKGDEKTTKFIANVKNIELVNTKSSITQDFLSEPLKHEIALKKAKISNLSSDFAKPFDIDIRLETGENLSLETKGKIGIEPLKADLNAKFEASDLAKLNKIVSNYLNAEISSGKIVSNAKIKFAKNLSANADFSLLNFALNDLNATKVASINAVNIKDIALTEHSAALKNLSIDEPFAVAHIFADKSINLSSILKSHSDSNETKSQKEPAKNEKKSDFAISLEDINIKNASVDFSDDSLVLPFVFAVKNLNASIDKIAPDSITRVNSQGTIGSGGSANVDVRLDAFAPKKFSDISLKFKDVELNEVTPYSATFVGRKIDSGLLDLSLVYSLKDSKLDGKNDIRIDTIKLGQSVESPEAMSLPLQLAISILQDSNNVINLNLPVSGDLDNPEFSYGGIVLKAVLQIFTDVVTSPFRLMGNILGIGNAEELAGVDFATGKAEILDSQAKKIANFKEITDKKKDVVFVINPAYDEAQDTLAIQRRALDREVSLQAKARNISEYEVLKGMASMKLKNPPADPYNELVKLQKVKPSQLENLAKERAQNLKNAMLLAGVPSDQVEVLDKIKTIDAKMQIYVALPMGIENKK